jgi:hypothetical protein
MTFPAGIQSDGDRFQAVLMDNAGRVLRRGNPHLCIDDALADVQTWAQNADVRCPATIREPRTPLLSFKHLRGSLAAML